MQLIKLYGKNLLIALIGAATLAMGVSLYIMTDVGIGPWDALAANLAEYFPRLNGGLFTISMTIGYWVFVLGIIVVIVSLLFSPKKGQLLALITGLTLGLLVDLWMAIYQWMGLMHVLDALVVRWLFFFVSLLLVGTGTALMVMSNVPPSPVDTLMMSIRKRFYLPFSTAKFLTELLAFVSVLTLNVIYEKPFNSIGFGTIITVLSLGIIVVKADKGLRRFVHPNEITFMDRKANQNIESDEKRCHV